MIQEGAKAREREWTMSRSRLSALCNIHSCETCVFARVLFQEGNCTTANDVRQLCAFACITMSTVGTTHSRLLALFLPSKTTHKSLLPPNRLHLNSATAAANSNVTAV